MGESAISGANVADKAQRLRAMAFLLTPPMHRGPFISTSHCWTLHGPVAWLFSVCLSMRMMTQNISQTPFVHAKYRNVESIHS
jgi:hypothetical protein